MSVIPNIKVRGIRSPVPSGHVLGRQSPGSGDVELIPTPGGVASVAYSSAQGANAIAVSEAYTNAQLATYAPLNSPHFTGDPTAPTATPLTNNTQLATTAYVDAAVAAGGGGFTYCRTPGTGVGTVAGAFATVGAGLAPLVGFDIVSVFAQFGSMVIGHNYIATLSKVSSSLVISAVTNTPAFTAASTAAQTVQFTFSSPVALTAGAFYVLSVTDQSSTPTTTIPMEFNSTCPIPFYATTLPVGDSVGAFRDFLELASNGPAVSNTFSAGPAGDCPAFLIQASGV